MKKKLSMWFSLMVILSSLIVEPISIYAKTTTQPDEAIQTTDVQKQVQATNGKEEGQGNQQDETVLKSEADENIELPAEVVPVISAIESNKVDEKEPLVEKSTTAQSNQQSNSSATEPIIQETPKVVEDNKNGEQVQQSENKTIVKDDEQVNSATKDPITKETVQLTEIQPRAPSNRRQSSQNNVITSFSITDDKGNPLNEQVTQWTNFRINGNFDLPNNTVSSGDITTITLPEQLKFASTENFALKDTNGQIVAHAVINPDNKTIVLTYTDYVENHSDVKGSFYFYAQVDYAVVKESQIIPVVIQIDKETTFHAGEIDYGVYVAPGRTLDKSGWFEGGSDQVINFRVEVNRSKNDFNNVVIQDSLANQGAKIVEGSIEIGKGDWVFKDNNWLLENEQNVTNNYTIQMEAGNKGFSVNLGDIKASDGFNIKYLVELEYHAVDGEIIRNGAKMLSDYQVINEFITNVPYHQGGGAGEGAVFTIRIHKVNEDGDNLVGAEFEVIRDRNQQSFGTIVTDPSGNASIGNLLKDDYTLKETKAPEGYDLLPEDIKISPSDFGSIKEAFKEVVNKKTVPQKTDVKGSKIWKDNNNQDGKRPNAITVNLLADGAQIDSKVVTLAENWEYEFTNLPKFKDGKEIIYTVTENQVADYNTDIKGFDITNSYTPGKTSVSVTKKWVDANNQDGKRPDSIQVQLLANGQKQGDLVELNANNNWTTTWNDLDQKTAGQDIVYTIEEVSVKDYTSTVDNSDKGNILLTNSYTPETTEIQGLKTWSDNNNQDGKRPESIVVNLLANGQKVANQTVKADSEWKFTFANLPKFKEGKEIVYTISEEAVENYTSEIQGTTINNSYIPEITSISGQKIWDDADNQDGKRPSTIRVNLHADGQKVSAQDVEADNNWKFTFANLPKYKDGKEIIYTISEEAVEGYLTNVEGNIITNSRIPETIKISGEKVWNDSNNQDGKRPATIMVNLLADGTKVTDQTVSADTEWKFSFTNLPKYKDGKEISYTVTEEVVENYTTEIQGTTIINSYNPEITHVSGYKIWVDADNKAGKRPEFIVVELLADGEKISQQTVEATSGWEFIFTNLPKFKDGKEIVYQIRELAVSGYESKVYGFTITNILKEDSTIPDKPEKPTPPKPTPPKPEKVKPTLTTKKQLPKTGTNNNTELQIAALAFVLLGVGLVLPTKKRVIKKKAS